jgi:glycosyltransferase involved in cell wall biosynthesis
MKIVFQHNGILPVKRYGGIERILFWLMKELVHHGHKVVLIGHKESEITKYGIQLINNPEDGKWEALVPKDADLVHLTYNHPIEINKPVLTNIHGNGQVGEIFPQNTVFVSKKHALVHGSDQYVHNGIDLTEYPIQKLSQKNDIQNLLFLAKASWKVKNLKDSIKIAKTTKKKLHIIGGRSFLPSRFVSSYGFVGGKEKNRIIQSCDALLFPVRWHEPFGIAIIEAMAFGLPVFGSQYGSLPELINEEVGRTYSTKDDLINDLLDCSITFNSHNIRNYVETYFNMDRVAKDYIRIYERILDGEKLNKNSPTWSEPKAPLDILPF